MCDEITEAENAIHFERLRLSRREVGVGAGAALATILTGCDSGSPVSPSPRSPDSASQAPSQTETGTADTTRSRTVTFPAPDGTVDAFFVTPKTGKAPGVIVWPDIAGLRPAFMTMATRLASAGYAALVVNQYYRSSTAPVLQEFSEWRTDAGRAKINPMKDALTPERIASDAKAVVAWLEQQPEVDPKRKLGSAGYCMTGSYTFRTAAAAPERVAVAASFHGGGLVTDEPTSPHLLFPKMKGSVLICIARNDDEREPETKDMLRRAADEARLAAEIEVYPAQHGFCCIDTPVYDEAQAERAWARMLAQFEQFL